MKYAINVSQSNVGLTGIHKLIQIGGWAELSNEEAKHSEVEEAIRRGWVKISLTKPEPAAAFKPNIDISEPAVHGSKTIPTKAPKETV